MDQEPIKLSIFLKTKNGIAKVESRSSFEEEKNDGEVDMIIKAFKSFLKIKDDQKFLCNKKR